MSDKFSAVLSVYDNDNEDHFNIAVKSLLNQTLQPSEIVIVVDGPVSAGIDKVLQEISSNEIVKIIKLPKNVGRGAARHTAISATENDLVAIMDADDICVEDRFEKQVKAMNTSEVDILGGYIEEFRNEPGDLKKTRPVQVSHDKIIQFSKWKQPVNHVTMMFRKHVYFEIGGYKPYKMLEDFDLFHRLIKHGAKFQNIPENLVFVRIPENYISKRTGARYAREERMILREMYKSGHINLVQFLFNTLARSLVRALPYSLVDKIYNNILRKKDG